MIISKEDFSFWVKLVSGTVPKNKVALDIHKAVIMEYTGDDLILMTNSHFNAIKISDVLEPSGNDKKFMVAVDSEELSHAVSGDGDQVRLELIELEESPSIHITIGKAEYDLSLLPTDEFLNPFEQDDWEDHGTLKRGSLLKNLETAVPFLESNPLRPVLMGVYFQGNYMYAGNAIQEARISLDIDVPDGISFIPHALITLLKSGGSEKTNLKFYSNEVWAGFSHGPFTFLTKLSDEDYGVSTIDQTIEIGKVIKGIAKINAAGLSEALKRIDYFLEEGFVKLKIDRAGTAIQAYSGKRWKAKSLIPGTLNLKDGIVITLEKSQLESMLTLVKDELILRVSSDEDSPVYLKSSDSKTEYIVMPVAEE